MIKKGRGWEKRRKKKNWLAPTSVSRGARRPKNKNKSEKKRTKEKDL